MLWLIFAGMLAAALGFLLLPLWRARTSAPDRAAYDLEVYRDQLAEVGLDEGRGILGPEESAAAKLEIERRMLRAGAELKGSHSTSAHWRLASLAVVAALVPLATVLIYLRLGQPGLPDQPFAERPHAGAVAEGGQAGQIAEMVHRLAERLKANPGDPNGWTLLGRSYLVLKRYDDAVSAYGKAAELQPNDADSRMAWGEAQVFAADGTVTPSAEAIFKQTLALDPKHPGARYYLALQRMQAGDGKGAVDGWLALVRDSPADAPWRPTVEGQLQATARSLSLPLPNPLPWRPAEGAPAAPAPGPSAADMQAAAGMSSDDRNQMIRSMVQRLADRLNEQPDDFDGWLRLARAYQVLGETDKARDALGHATKLRPDDPALKQALVAPSAAAPAALPAPAPTSADMQAAAAMPPEQRTAMIQTMVQRLADRLKEQPNDYDGWMRLGRAYQVLGREQDAGAAFDRAAALRPDDPQTLLARATALVEAAGNGKPLPPAAETLFRQVLAMDPDSPEALWYVGIAEQQAGRPQVAAVHWRRLLAKLDPKSTDYAEVAKALAGIDKPR